MPERMAEANYLRDRARRLRDIADIHKTSISDQLLNLARDMEARADALEARSRGAPGSG